jgi:hypothetical protein
MISKRKIVVFLLLVCLESAASRAMIVNENKLFPPSLSMNW